MSGELVRLDDYREPPLEGEVVSRFEGPLSVTRVAEFVRIPESMLGRPVRFRTVDPLGNLETEPPGWWVCPDCGRRRDRAGEPRTVTSVICTGPAAAYTRRHRPTEMRVQR